MKTERRHELQTNQLADSLAHWIEAAKPYSRAVLALLVALVVLVFAWGYLSVSNSRKAGDGWNEYFEAINSQDPRDGLSDIAEHYPDTPVAEWARAMLADIQLADGTSRLFLDKNEGRIVLRQAADKYQSILHDSRQPMLLQRATYGLARAHEALGTLDKAREEYRSIAAQWPDSPYVSDAEARAKDLDQQVTKNFYDWFAKYEPPRPVAREPGKPGTKPDFSKDPFEGAGFNLPTSVDDNKGPATVFPKTDAEEPSEPAADGAPGAGSAAPAGDQPAADEKPAAGDEKQSAEPAPQAAGQDAPAPQ